MGLAKRHFRGGDEPCSLPALLAKYGVATGYLLAFVVVVAVCLWLPPDRHAALLRWASTNVENLRHHPVRSLLASTLVPEEYLLVWPAVVAFALFGANRAVGNWRLVAVCLSGHVIGTVVSEGILDYRVGHGLLPESATSIVDSGPSYVVLSAIVLAVWYGSWLSRLAALLDFAVLVVVGQIFDGLTSLEVPAVGHVTALAVAVLAGAVLHPGLRAGRRRVRSPRQDDSPPRL